MGYEIIYQEYKNKRDRLNKLISNIPFCTDKNQIKKWEKEARDLIKFMKEFENKNPDLINWYGDEELELDSFLYEISVENALKQQKMQKDGKSVDQYND